MTQTTINSKKNSKLYQYLFQPFELIAGGKALLLGLISLLLTGWLAYLANLRFDGVIDLHMPLDINTGMMVFFSEQLLNWLSLSIVLLVFGLLFAKSFRIIDLLGTQALARVPMLIVALSSFLFPVNDVNQYMQYTFLDQGEAVKVATYEIIAFGIFILFALFMLIWMIYLMYRSFSISCNISGVKAIVLFIIGLLAAEVISKVVLHYWIPQNFI